MSSFVNDIPTTAAEAIAMTEAAKERGKEVADRLAVTRETFLSIQVCTSITDPAELAHLVNQIHVAGTEHGWIYSDDPDHTPVPCAEREGWTHVVFTC